MAPQFLPVVNQAPTVGANQNAYLNAARGYIPDPATAAGLGLPQQYTTYQASDGKAVGNVATVTIPEARQKYVR